MTNEAQRQKFAEGNGFLAALDQSGGSSGKALLNYGIKASRYNDDQEMMALMHTMRVRLMTSPAFSGDKIVGAILFEHTMKSRTDGMMSADYLWQKRHVLPLLKIDVGLAEAIDGVALMKPIPEMDARLSEAREMGIFGTKMRSVIQRANQASIERVVDQQFEFGVRILDHGLIPILEPEVSIDSPEKEECENLLRDSLLRHLEKLSSEQSVALKLTLPEVPDHYLEVIRHPKIIRTTALSGGYDQDEACRRLSQNTDMIASFSRALAEGLSETMSDEQFNAVLQDNVDAIYTASCENNE